MPAAQDLILSAHRLIGLIRVGQAASALEVGESLAALNALVENWSTERLNIYSIGTQTYTFIAGTQIYTLGPGGTWGTTRPVKIESAVTLLPNSGGTGNLSFECELLNATEWRELKERGRVSDVPRKLYCDYALPVASIYVWPSPAGLAYVDLQTWTVIPQFPDLATVVALAPGYARALTYALAVELGPRYGLPASQPVMQTADEAKAAIRALNGAQPSEEPTEAPVNATPQGGQSK